MKAISIKQPWADFILFAGKDVENRTWNIPKDIIGEDVLLVSSQKIDRDYLANNSSKKTNQELQDITEDKSFRERWINVRTGQALGIIRFTGKENPDSEWAIDGQHAHCVEVIKVFDTPFLVAGQLRFFDVEVFKLIKRTHEEVLKESLWFTQEHFFDAEARFKKQTANIPGIILLKREDFKGK